MKKNLKGFIMSMLLLSSITACASDTPKSTETAGNPIIDSESPSESDEAKENKLSISVCWDFYYMDEAVEKFKEIHPGVEIVVNKYANDYEKYTTQTATELMAGTASDILDSTGIEFIKYADSGLLSDFNELINKDETFNDEDYFSNVLKGMEYKNGLYVFPTSFTYSMIGVNNKVSDQLVSKFQTYETVTDRDLLDMYMNTEDKSGFYLSSNFDATIAVMNNIRNFIDYENKTCNFDNETFIKLITDAKSVTESGKAEGTVSSSNIAFPSTSSDESKKYLFSNIYGDNYQYFLGYKEYEYFSDYIPTSNDKGQLNLTPSKSFCISKNAGNKELAWEFIKFLTSAEANTDTFVPGYPIKKEVYDTYISDQLYAQIEWLKEEELYLDVDPKEAVDKAIAKFQEMSNMPMIYQYSPYLEVVYEDMKMFRNATMTAEQVASDLQNKISLALME